MRKYLKGLLAVLFLAGMLLPGAALAHFGSHSYIYGKYYVETEATCTEYGLKYPKCDGCDYIDYSNPIRIEKKSHQYSSVATQREATCSSTGIVTYTCKNCGHVKEEEIPKTNNHRYGEWYVAPGNEATCDQAGLRERVCQDCGSRQTEKIPAGGNNHQYGEWKVTKEATCTSAGSRTRTCARCGKTVTETIAADGAHAYGEWTTIREATCTKSGSRSHTCTKCGKTETETIPAGGKNHRYTEWEVVKEPTCTKKGQEMRRCKLCGDLQYKQLPKAEHTMDEWTTTKEANCRQEGKRTATCSVCGRKITEKIPKTEHDFEEWVIEIPETDSSMGRRSSTCRLCGRKQVEDFYPEGTLYKGGENPKEEVEELQKALTALGLYKGKITGEYDKATADAVKKFEKSVGMKQDGICWPKVKRMLGLGSGASDPISSNAAKVKLKLEAVVVSPRKDDYIPGDQITIQWTLTNTSQKNAAKSVRFCRFTGQKANRNKDMEITRQDTVAKGEVFSDTYVYTVTPEDVQNAEFVLSFIGRCKFGSTNAESNTVRFVFSGSTSRESSSGSDEGKWSPPGDSEDTSGDDSGDGSPTPAADAEEVPAPASPDPQICKRVLIAEEEGTIEYGIIECERHETAASVSGRMMEEGNYTGAIQFWSNEITRLYQDRTEGADGEGKSHMEAEQTAFENQMKALEASIRLICSAEDAAAVIAKERMNKCFSLCYEVNTATAPRTDSFQEGQTVLNGTDDSAACSQETVPMGNGSIRVVFHLCGNHRETLAAARRLAESAGTGEEKAAAWQQIQKDWLVALNAMYDQWYMATDISLQDTVAADRRSFDALVDARRNTLADLYPEDPVIVEEALAYMIMERTELVCGLLHTAGVLTDAP